MSKFVELSTYIDMGINSKKVLVDLSQIVYVLEEREYLLVKFNGGTELKLKEPFQNIQSLLTK